MCFRALRTCLGTFEFLWNFYYLLLLLLLILNSFVCLTGKANVIGTFGRVSGINSRPESYVWCHRTNPTQFPRLYLEGEAPRPPLTWGTFWSELHSRTPGWTQISVFLAHMAPSEGDFSCGPSKASGLRLPYWRSLKTLLSTLTSYFIVGDFPPFPSPSLCVQINGRSLLSGASSAVR